MIRAILCLTLAAGAAGAECPPPPDHGAREAELIRRLQEAPDELTARRLNPGLWEIWTDAPDDKAQAMLDRGMRRIREYNFAGAVEALDDLVAYCPDYAEGYNQRAFAYFLQLDYASALADLDRAIELSPRHVAARAGRALTLMGMGRMAVAQSELRAALELNPWLPERRMLIEPAGEDI